MMTRFFSVLFALTGSLLIASFNTEAKQQDAAIYLAAGSALENTERNVRDKDGTTLTPDDQKGDKRDVKITTKIRKALVEDKHLSVNAQNVKIITGSRIVTLRGIVENADESMKVEQIAKKTRGVLRVDNQLEFKAP
ncbi:MAG: BON domain-containing protein [Methylococcaceae bacterium]|nr:BON domain-containing protein [Methylococcaceae bacterium]